MIRILSCCPSLASLVSHSILGGPGTPIDCPVGQDTLVADGYAPVESSGREHHAILWKGPFVTAPGVDRPRHGWPEGTRPGNNHHGASLGRLDLGQAFTYHSLIISGLKESLKMWETRVNKRILRIFLDFVRQICPWFPEEGTIDEKTWTRVRDCFRDYYKTFGSEKFFINGLWFFIIGLWLILLFRIPHNGLPSRI